MWEILQNLHHNRRSHGKKRATRKANGPGKSSAIDEESTRNTLDASEVQENVHSSVENSSVETKPTPSSLPPKNSMKSRLKSLITEEMYKRKGRHQRSTSYPTRAPLDQITIQHHESSSVDLPADNNQESLHSDLPRPGSSRTDSCELTTMLRLHYLKQSEVTQPVRDHTMLRDKLVYAIEQTKCDSLQESKLFMDALDLLNLRKEVFLKILQDPSSSLAHQRYRRQAPSLTKSVSFPVSGPSARTDFKKDSYNNTVKEDNDNNNNYYKHLAIVEKPRALKISDNVLKRRDNNEKVLVLKRFKNLREKIKHVIRGHNRLKENNRIIMDAVHHMIPYGYNRMKEDKFGNYNKKKSHKRTSSLDESHSRYNQLLDISSNKEVKDHNNCSDKLRFGTGDNAIPRHFKRILSLPDLRTYSSIQLDDSSNVSTSGQVASDSVKLTEQKPFDVGLENNNFEARGVLESRSQENLFEVGSAFDESADSKTWETASSHDLNLESVWSSGPPPLDSGQVSEIESDYQEEDELGPESLLEYSKFPMEDDPSSTQYDPTSLIITTTPENQATKKLYHDLLQQLHVDTKNKAEFNYVRDVLELSGFTRGELLGKWHSAYHPVDPMLFNEVEGGCLVSQPGCSGNEEDGTCDRLLLFDLINEVLLDIHERSFNYWPAPLTARSHMHRMPKGYRVLEEVWAEISWLLSLSPETDQSIDDGVSRDLAKGDRWMSVQMDAEFVGLEVEELIFDDLLEEIVSARVSSFSANF